MSIEKAVGGNPFSEKVTSPKRRLGFPAYLRWDTTEYAVYCHKTTCGELS